MKRQTYYQVHKSKKPKKIKYSKPYQKFTLQKIKKAYKDFVDKEVIVRSFLKGKTSIETLNQKGIKFFDPKQI